MSGNPESSGNYVPGDTEKKILEDDLVESSRTDSGFISSGNMIVSEEIIDEPEENKDNNLDEELKEDKEVMLLDSGVCLSENFSNLSLKNSNLNNLSSNSSKNVESDRGKSPEVRLNISDQFWKTYYEQDENGDTLLHLAIGNGQLQKAYSLICQSPHPRLLDTPNDEALTPLHLAVLTRQPFVARWLIVAGARPGPRNIDGNSPLHLAVQVGEIDCLQAIMYPVQNKEREDMKLNYSVQKLEHYDLEQWNYNGQTCVHVAALRGNVEIMRHLIWYGANINAREGLEGNTALHYAVKRNDEHLINFLLNECTNLDVNITNYGGHNVFFTTGIKESIVHLLKKNGIEMHDNSDDDYSSEDDYSDSDHEMSYQNDRFIPKMVDASA
ncbi:hypothetical protein WA026_012232 [Henosepilachna vigintioctopunctata]|uniref:NF-kappa-B inhibitor cactus n=1 Tax=Henosepilachna vigintioctopunctata TaxID=420089 RepID=A0AAW1V868_9CUCU